MREQHRTMKGLYPVVGLQQTAVPYEVLERQAGKTKWNFLSLVNLSIDAITSVSTAPLRLATIFGVMCAMLSLFFVVFTITKTLIMGEGRRRLSDTDYCDPVFGKRAAIVSRHYRRVPRSGFQ